MYAFSGFPLGIAPSGLAATPWSLFAIIPLSLELSFTKTVRTASVLPSERRLDFRFALSGFGVTARYAEYSAERDGFLTTFTRQDRVAQTIWILVGFGI